MAKGNEEVNCSAPWNHFTSKYGSSNGGSMSGAIT